MVMSEINEYYITFQYENHFVEHTFFYSIIDALNRLRIFYRRYVYTDFRKNGNGYDKITRVYLGLEFDTMLNLLKYCNEKG